MNNDLLLDIVQKLNDIGALMAANFILGVIFVTWYLFDSFLNERVEKFYARIEKRKKEEKDMAEMGQYIENQFKK